MFLIFDIHFSGSWDIRTCRQKPDPRISGDFFPWYDVSRLPNPSVLLGLIGLSQIEKNQGIQKLGIGDFTMSRFGR